MDGLHVSPAEVSVTVENTGARAGAEVVRLYIAFSCTPTKGRSRFIRPKRTLAGFDKVFLEAGERKVVGIPITRDGTSVWDEQRDSWCCEGGEYVASVVTGEQSLGGTFVVEKDVFWRGL